MLGAGIADHCLGGKIGVVMEKKKWRYDALRLFRACRLHWVVILASAAAFLCLGAAAAYLKKQKVEVCAQLKLPAEISTGGILSLAELAGSFSMGDVFGGSSTDNEIAMICSHAVFERVARELNLNIGYYEKVGPMKWMGAYERSALMLDVDPRIADTITVAIRFDLSRNRDGSFKIKAKTKDETLYKNASVTLPATIDTKYGGFGISPTPCFDTAGEKVNIYRITYCSYSIAAQDYVEKVDVYAPSKRTDFIALSYITTDATFGKRLLGSIIENYNIVGNEEKGVRSGYDLAFIDRRIKSLESELEGAEAEMERFKEANRLTNPSHDAAILLQKEAELEAQLLKAQTRAEIFALTLDFLSDPEHRYELIPGIAHISAGEDAIADGALNDAVVYNQMILRRMNERSKVKRPTAAMKLLDEQIDAMRVNIENSMRRALDNANVALSKVRRENDATLGRIGSVPKIEREYVGLERELMLKQQLYLFLLKQREEASMGMEKMEPSLITVDAPYVLRDPPGLSTKMILVLALLVGLCAGVLLVYMYKMCRTPYGSVDEIRVDSKAPVIGCVDTAEDFQMSGEAGRDIRMLRDAVDSVLRACGGNAVLAAGVNEGDGGARMSQSLAEAFRLSGRDAVVVNADLPDEEEGSCVSSADVIASPEFAAGLNARKRECDCVIVVGAPLRPYGGAEVLAPLVDVTLILMRLKSSTPQDMRLVNEMVADARFPRMAVVVNIG